MSKRKKPLAATEENSLICDARISKQSKRRKGGKTWLHSFISSPNPPAIEESRVVWSWLEIR